MLITAILIFIILIIITLWVKRAATPSAPTLNRHVRKLSSRGLDEYFSKIFARFHHNGAAPTLSPAMLTEGLFTKMGWGQEDLG